MSARKRKRKHKTAKQKLEAMKPRNAVLVAAAAQTGSGTLPTRVEPAKKQKDRPRNSNRAERERGDQ